MQEIEQALHHWESSLCKNVSLGGLYARNPISHKWKTTYRCLVLRESVFWRTHDLLTQAHRLYQAGHILGSRILIRSGIEAIATLIYLNRLVAQVLDSSLIFQEFSIRTSLLLLGSRDRSTKHSAINIMSVLDQCDKKYPGIVVMYSTLSESAHPNFEGVCFGYSRVDHAKRETNFSNNWAEMWADCHESLMKLCIMVFEAEYNDLWISQFERLEAWLVANDAQLGSMSQ